MGKLYSKQEQREELRLEVVKEELDISEFNLGAVDPNLPHIDEIEGEFGKEAIINPKEVCFDTKASTAVLEGFTEGALRNIVTLSKNEIRLYKVTLSTIELLSCSKTGLDSSKFGVRSFHADKNECSVQVFEFKGNQSTRLFFDYKTGKLLKEEKTEFWGSHQIQSVVPIPNQRLKYSKTKNFIKFIAGDRISLRFNNWSDIGLLRSGKISRWLYQYRRNRRLDLKTKVFLYSKKYPKLTLLISSSQGALVFDLVDIKRKKLFKTSKVSLENLFGVEGLRNFLLDPEQRNRGNEAYDNPNPIKILSYVYLSSTRSVLLSVRVKNLEILAKFENFFYSEKMCKKLIFVKQRRVEGRSLMLEGLGGDRVLLSHSAEMAGGYSRPVSWVDPKTLKQEEFMDSKLKYKVNGLLLSEGRRPRLVKIGQNRVLVVNPFYAFIYDIELNEVISKQRLVFEKEKSSKFFNFGNLYIRGSGRILHMIKTEKRAGVAPEAVTEIKTFDLRAYLPNLSYSNGKLDFNIFQLSNQNFLYVKTDFFDSGDQQFESTDQQPRNQSIRPGIHLIALEIDSSSLEVLSVKVSCLGEFSGYINASNIALVKDLILINKVLGDDGRTWEQRGGVGGDDSSSLLLLDLDLNLLDACSLAKLRLTTPIAAVFEKRVVSLGRENSIYLHEIDLKAKKLVLLKTLKLAGLKILKDRDRRVITSSPTFCCMAAAAGATLTEFGVGDRTILKFDINLELQSGLKLVEINPIYAPYPLGEGNLVAFFNSRSQFKVCVFVLDLGTGACQLAHKFNGKSDKPNYSVLEGDEGLRVFSMELASDRLIKVVLG